jgi:hypothetical protein
VTEPKHSRSTKRTRNASDQQKGKRNSQLAQQTRLRTEKPELGMTHMGIFHHFSANSADKNFPNRWTVPWSKMETESFPRPVFRDGFRFLNARGELSERKPGLAGLSSHGTAD